MDRGRLIALDTPENLKRVLPTGELIEIGYATLDPAVIPVIRNRNDVKSVEIQDQLLRISVQNGSRVLPLVLADLEQHSVQVLTITIRAPSLEDVFIYLTGTGLEGG